MSSLENALQIFYAAIETVKPESLIKHQLFANGDKLHIQDRIYNLQSYNAIYVIGAGKASAFMALALEKRLGDFITRGVVVTKYGHAASCGKIKICEAGHPLPDANTLVAAQEIINLVEQAGENDLVLCLLSGGGSALLEKLPDGISLDALQKTFDLLLACGASIDEMNIIRKHLSQIKGGHLLQSIAPAHCITLIISDVIGDSLATIASGPTAPDNSTFADSLRILEKYELTDELPKEILHHLQAGIQGEIPETLKELDPLFAKVDNIILGNNSIALQAAQKKALELGYNALIFSSCLQGEAQEAAKIVVRIAEEIKANRYPLKPPACLLFGGETTVTVKGNGKGGRNQEFVLAALTALKKLSGPYFLMSCGTDGTDGPTDAAGAFVTPELQKTASEIGLNPLDYLQNNDAYHFFAQCNGLVKTGPTGTNVMDIVILLL